MNKQLHLKENKLSTNKNCDILTLLPGKRFNETTMFVKGLFMPYPKVKTPRIFLSFLSLRYLTFTSTHQMWPKRCKI